MYCFVGTSQDIKYPAKGGKSLECFEVIVGLLLAGACFEDALPVVVFFLGGILVYDFPRIIRVTHADVVVCEVRLLCSVVFVVVLYCVHPPITPLFRDVSRLIQRASKRAGREGDVTPNLVLLFWMGLLTTQQPSTASNPRRVTTTTEGVLTVTISHKRVF
jgi:hypothetical protein